MRTQQDAEMQLNTALAFLDMAGDTNNRSLDRKKYLLMALMHAQTASVIAACINNGKLQFQAGNIASDCHKGLEALLDCSTIDQGLEEIRKARQSRQQFDKSIGINVEDYKRGR